MKFTKIPSDAFQKLQINAGILTTDFTPATGTIGEAGQIGATTGGVNFTATPSFSDFGEDIDNTQYYQLKCIIVTVIVWIILYKFQESCLVL